MPSPPRTGSLSSTRHVFFTHFLSKLGALPAASAFFHPRLVDVSSVPDAEWYAVSRLPVLQGYYPLVVHHGFVDEVV